MKKILILAAALVLAAGTAHAQKTWAPQALPANLSTSWITAANWSSTGGGVPTPSDAVIIPNGLATYPIITPGNTATCRTLTIQGGSSNPTVTVQGPASNGAVGTLVIGTGTSVAGTSILTINSGGKLVIDGTVQLKASLTNNGTVTSGSAGLLKIDNAASTTTLIRGTGTTALNDITFTNGTTFDLTLTNPVTVAGRALLAGGNVNANTPISAAVGGRLRFVSSAVTGTPGSSPCGYVYRSGGGQLNGTITVQRAIAPGYNLGDGYRHYSTPVAGPAFTSLATTDGAIFTPQLNTSYNYPITTPAVPPNVAAYIESLVPTTPAMNNSVNPPAPYDAFSYGWRSPSTTTLETGRGYTLRINSAAKVSLTGLANSGPYATGLLTRGNNATQSGWNFVGNPYPTPLNILTAITDNLYDNRLLVPDDADPSIMVSNPAYNPGGCDGTAYFFRSDGTYSGGYTFYTAGVGSSDGVTQLFPVMQGFFVRKVTTADPKAYVFSDAQRADPRDFPTTALTPFYRGTGPAPVAATALFWLEATDVLAKTTDRTAVGFRPGATPGHDYRYDAVRPGDNVKMPTLFTVGAGQDACMLNCLPPLTGTLTVPVGLRTLVPGRAYTLATPARQQLPAGTRVWLEDRATGRVQEMSAGQAIAFTADAETYEHRFFLRFVAAPTLTAAAAPERPEVAVYPNPAGLDHTLLVSGNKLAGPTATATLLNAFGRVVLTREVPVRNGLLTQELPTAGLPAGVYLLRVASEGNNTTRRLEIR